MNQINQSTVEKFYGAVKSYSYKGEGTPFPHTDFVFFVGAGFSKAWDKNFYGGKELFEKLPQNVLFRDFLECYLQSMSWCKYGAFSMGSEFNMSFNGFKEVMFSLDMYEKYKELRPKYIDSNGLKMIREKLNALIALKMWEHNPYLQGLHISSPTELTKNQNEIINFFNLLRDQKTGSNLVQEGIRINHITTNYDFVIESIFDAGFNKEEDDDGESHLLYAYRGFTPNEYSGFTGIPAIKNDDLIESLFKLNGGLEIYYNSDGTYRMDYNKKTENDLQKESPLLILPSYEQDYSHPYFKEILQKSNELLTVAKVLIIVGYSLPEEDILIRFLLKHFALDKTSFQDKVIFYINKGDSNDELEEKLKSVFRESIDLDENKRFFTFLGSFNEFVEQFNQLWSSK